MSNRECNALLKQIRDCTICTASLPLSPLPILQASSGAKILIAGQAPGIKTHQKARPFDDASGERLRSWLGVDKETFYNPELFAIVPMGFCFPGTFEKNGKKQGDKPPRPECAANWHPRLLPQLNQIELTLVLGQYAIDYHIQPLLPGNESKINVTQAVERWQEFWPHQLVLPHPSPRNNLWLKRHPEFEQTLLPLLRRRVHEILNS